MKNGEKTTFAELPIGAFCRQYLPENEVTVKIGPRQYAYFEDLKHPYVSNRHRIVYYVSQYTPKLQDWLDAMAILKACLTLWELSKPVYENCGTGESKLLGAMRYINGMTEL